MSRDRTATLTRGTGSFTRALTQVPRDEWPEEARALMPNPPREVWRSRNYLVQVYRKGGHERLSVIRTILDPSGRWAGAIEWDDLQRIKRECGRGDRWAVEVFPPDDRVVNVQNMRHLWLLLEQPPYGWHAPEEGQG